MSQLLEFSVLAESETQARSRIRARNFELIVDEPSDLGGSNEGPNPVEYLLASYAGCVNVVAHLTAQELGLDPGKLKISVKGSLNPTRLLEGNSGVRAGFQTIDLNLITEKPLSEKLRREWLEAIEFRCPVNDNLSAATPLNIQIISSIHAN